MMINEEKIEERKPIEQIFSSKGRIKIIKLLAEKIELNISEIIKRCKSNHTITKKHLKVLTEANIIQEKIYGRIKIYRLRTEDYRVKAIKNLIDLWGKE